MNQLISQLESKSESSAHKIIKQLIYKYILKYNSNIVEAFLEKSFSERRADVYFKFRSGKKLVVEVQNSYITPKEINKRTRDYNRKNIYVLWVLYGHGPVVDTPKNPEHKKNVKISPAENRLHRFYGGRVYYVNLYSKNGKPMVTKPYALHFSNSDKIAPSLFKRDYDSFLVRNMNFSFISNWGLMFKTLNSYKIAIVTDINPYIITFFKELQHGTLNTVKLKKFLIKNAIKLKRKGKPYYYELRDKFNSSPSSQLLLFLNLSCFRNTMRFTQDGKFSSQFGSTKGLYNMKSIKMSLINTYIIRIKFIKKLLSYCQVRFLNQDFREIFDLIKEDDIVYFDPPYLKKLIDYYGKRFTEKDWKDLITYSEQCKSSLMLSNWYSDFKGLNNDIFTIYINLPFISFIFQLLMSNQFTS